MKKCRMFICLLSITFVMACQQPTNNDCANTSSYAGGTATQMKGFYVGIIGWSNQQDNDIVNQYCVAHVHDYSKIATDSKDAFNKRTNTAADVGIPEFTITSAKECLTQMTEHQNTAALYLATDFTNLRELLIKSGNNPLLNTNLNNALNIQTLKIPLKGRLQVHKQLSRKASQTTDKADKSSNATFHYSEVSEVGVTLHGEDRTLLKFFVEQVGFQGIAQNQKNQFEGSFVSEDDTQNDVTVNWDWKKWDALLTTMIYSGIDSGITALWNKLSPNSSNTHLYGAFVDTQYKARMISKVSASGIQASTTVTGTPAVAGNSKEQSEMNTGDSSPLGSTSYNADGSPATTSTVHWHTPSASSLLPGSFVMVRYRVVAAMNAAHVNSELENIAQKAKTSRATDPVFVRLDGAEELTFESLSSNANIPQTTFNTQKLPGLSGVLVNAINAYTQIEIAKLSSQQNRQRNGSQNQQEKEQTNADDEECKSQKCQELKNANAGYINNIETLEKEIARLTTELGQLRRTTTHTGDGTVEGCPAQQ